MKELMRPETSDDYGFKELQNVILNMVCDIDSFCDAHDIRYFLMGGSALGAKRHGGFIPWDDDLDVFMTPDNYEKFRENYNRNGNKEKYYLQELGASNGRVITAKIRLNNSYYEEEILKGWKIHHGIFVDIFILHSCPDNMIKRYWQYIWAKYLIVKGLSNKVYKRRGNLSCLILRLIGLLPKRFLLDFGLKQVYRFRNEKSEYYCNFLGKALMKNGIYRREYFKDVKRVPFETISLKAPVGLEDFLAERFGDYMRFPSPERIRYEQHSSKWFLGDVEYADLSDESKLF